MSPPLTSVHFEFGTRGLAEQTAFVTPGAIFQMREEPGRNGKPLSSPM